MHPPAMWTSTQTYVCAVLHTLLLFCKGKNFKFSGFSAFTCWAKVMPPSKQVLITKSWDEQKRR